MAFQISPGVVVREIDLSGIVPAVATTEGAIAGVFRWGPLEKRVLVTDEEDLVNRFGRPSNLNAETWFTGASFLAYGNQLLVARAANVAGVSPSATVTVTKDNADVVLSTGNTTSLGIVTGLYVISSSNNGISVGAQVVDVINSTAFTISTASDALANTINDTLQFVSNTCFTAIANTGPVSNLAAAIVKNEDHFATIDGVFDTDIKFIARYPGELGNSLRVSVCANPNGYNSTVNLASFGANISFTVLNNSNTTTVTVASSNSTSATANATSFKNQINVSDLIEVGNTELGVQYLKVTEVSETNTTGNNATFTISFEDRYKLAEDYSYSKTDNKNVKRYWEFANFIEEVPGNSDYVLNFGNTAINSDELHVIVIDDKGKFTGVPGTILETYRGVSRATDAKSLDGAVNYWKAVVNDASQYVYAVNDLTGATSATAENLTNSTLDVQSLTFQQGKDGADEVNIPLGILTKAYDLYASAEEVDVSMLLQGRARSFQLANYLIDNIAEKRMDCIAFISPQKANVVNNIGNETDSLVAFRNNLRSTSYGVMDSGYKYMYDRYNDLYRWIPLNGDVAGLCVRTEQTNDAWWSPAGFNRGQIKNLVRLAWNPSRLAWRDKIYAKGINPVVTFPGQGTILFGDKTLLAKPSAFDRINVRRLFIVLEKSIAKSAQYTLFEFNDAFTRATFRNMVIPYLREVQGKRGIQDFYVVCDERNNTGQIIDRNEFVGDIYIKPARSINFIKLNFIAVRTDVSFSEVIQNF